MAQSRNLVVKAGPKALKHIKKNGFHPKDVKTIAAAAGGPKWFVIYHLTRYIAEHILPKTEGRINLLGSSVGGWQMACMSTSNPGAALQRLRDRYAGEIYNMPITTDEISRGCHATLSKTLTDDDISYIIDNQKVNLNIIAARGKGILRGTSKYSVYPGLLFNFLTNAINRKLIGLSFDRFIFSTQMEMPFDQSKSVLSSNLILLDQEKFRDVLMATAAIPLVMNGVKSVSGQEHNTFWDGGLTDYHMVLPYHQKGLVLIPHFFPDLTPGWMDKSLKYRRGKGVDLSNVIMIHPSDEFVRSLPKSRISSRDDFLEFGEDQEGRAKYWTEISERGNALKDELHQIIQSDNMAEIAVKF